jgi:hypothetical protein
LGDAAVTKTLTTLNVPAPVRTDGARQKQWAEACSVFPIYLALAKQLEIEIPFPQGKRTLPEKPDMELFGQVQSWLDAMDQQVMVHQLRHLLQMTTLNASESGLRALIQRHWRKALKEKADRDKVDFLLVQYFALCAPPKIYHKQIEPADVVQVMRPVLGDVDTKLPAWAEPLEKMIGALRGFRSLREILKTDFIEQGRKIKETVANGFYEPPAMVAFVRFNFLLRRTLIELMHADLIAIRAGLAHLDAAEVRILDCHHCGLSSAEPLAKVKEMADEWKQPFQKEYTERTVSQAFEKLLGLRTDVDRALEKVAGRATESPVGSIAAPRAAAPATPQRGTERAAQTAQPVVEPAALDFETCMEQIWEQLIATPPSKGRSMTTVKVGGARLLMSSWEVAAFVSENDLTADDLRRAVVARAMVTSALESAKESGNATSLDPALQVARVEVTRLQERVDVAKQAKDTEAAVNLGISTKRLLSALDEAEKL